MSRKMTTGLLAVVVVLGLIASACAPAVVVETTPQVVEKEVTKVVEIEKVVTPTPEPPPELGQHLIGDLEGPEVVTDPARFPTEYHEAPMLAKLVEAGALPPVEERLPEEPLVLEPVHEIGQYGGTWRRGFTGPSDQWNGGRAAGHDTLLFLDYKANEIVPNIAKGYEFADDGKKLILHLREGMKWSDGHPFTADDILFWYEDVFLNEELVPFPFAEMVLDGELVEVQKVDDYTVEYIFPAPYYLFDFSLASHKSAGSGHFQNARNMQGGFMPAHYMQQFHPNYVSQEELDQIVKEEGFDNWVNLFKFKVDAALNTEVPVVAAWRMTSPINTSTYVLERNPYSIWVDTEGNQLPYIDRIVMTLAEDLEVLNLRALAGEYDFQARHISIQKLPLFLENQAAGGYQVYLDPSPIGADVSLGFNVTYQLDDEINQWFNNTDFRRALSMAIDRDEINEVFFLGLGVPGSPVPPEDNAYNPGPEYRSLWSTHDPDKANEMLDSIGLTEKDSDGYRLRTDGEGRLRLEVTTMAAQFLPWAQMAEMIKEDWKEVGIELDIQDVERSLALSKNKANEVQLWMWANDTSQFPFTTQRIVMTEVNEWNPLGQLHGEWFATNGESGLEPPPRMREIYDAIKQGNLLTFEERVELGQEIWKIFADEVWMIGIVGQAPGSMGVRLANTDMGNVPARQYNDVSARNPGISRPETFYYKSAQ